MATLVAIGYGDQGTAEQVRETVQQQYGGTVIKTSSSDEDTKKLQDALQPPAATTGS